MNPKSTVNQRLLSLLSKNKKVVLPIAGVLIAVLVDWLRLGSTLPSLNVAASQRVLDRYGQEIRHALSLNGERRYIAPLDLIPEQLRLAFVQAEDRRFYTHHGVDWRAFLRGVFQSVKGARKVSGGSTITIQLVRTQWPEVRGLLHRPAQMLQALRLEANYTKGEILTHYLNTIPFGNRISGVGAACRYFFNKTCDQLSPGQIASLAILPRNPSLFLRKPAALLPRRNDLLLRLISSSEPLVLKQAQEEPIVFTRTIPEFYAPHITEKILEERRSEIEIHTTLDLELQKQIQKFLTVETLKRRGTGDSGAVLVLENKTGEVLAYVGSPDFFDPVHGMVDGVQVRRSPGSALKPFVYELALENNWDLFSIVPDIPMVFSTQRAIYEPTNYGGNFSGPRTIREALGNSKNLPALFMTAQLGEARVLEHLRRMGFSSLNQEASFYGVGIALGNGEVSLWELVQAYSTFARLGVAKAPTLYQNETHRSKRVIPEETAFLIVDTLRDPNAREEEFGRFGPLEFEYEVGAKTGTSSDYRDHWTVGFTKNLTIGVWRGNADSTPLVQRVSASHGAGPLFHKIVDLVHSYRQPSRIAQPENIELSRVCPLSGQKPGKQCSVTRLEYHLKGRAPKQQCEFHKSIKVPNCGGKSETITYVQLPKEYEEWVRSSSIPTLENQFREKCGGRHSLIGYIATPNNPMIVEPLDKTVYAIDPTIPLDHQEIRFALRNSDTQNRVRLYVNDQLVKTINGSEFFWPIQQGSFRFYVKRGNFSSNVVTLQVR